MKHEIDIYHIAMVTVLLYATMCLQRIMTCLHSIKDLIHKLYSGILLYHLSHLKTNELLS